jgi:arsenate reductase-like glutaredoxin family protein
MKWWPFITKQDREALHDVYRVVTYIKRHMTKREELKAAIQQIHDDATAIIEHADKSDAALKALQAKIDAGEDFSAELNELSGIHANFVAATKGLTEKTGEAIEVVAPAPPAPAPAETATPKIEWNEDRTEVRDLPDGEWRNPTDDEAKTKPTD